MDLFRKLVNVFDRMIELAARVAAALINLMMLSICAEVLLRYFLGRPIGWVIETSEWSLLYITFLAAAWVLKNEGHVKIDLLVSRLEPKVQALVSIITSAAGAIVCFVLAWYGAKVTWDLFQMGYYTAGILKLPKFTILAIIPVGSLLLFIQFLRRTYGYLPKSVIH